MRETRRMRETRSARSPNVEADPHLPSLQEVHLAAEVKELREHIAKLQAEAERTLGNRVRRRLRGGRKG
jgi:hypothetical protein